MKKELKKQTLKSAVGPHNLLLKCAYGSFHMTWERILCTEAYVYKLTRNGEMDQRDNVGLSLSLYSGQLYKLYRANSQHCLSLALVKKAPC